MVMKLSDLISYKLKLDALRCNDTVRKASAELKNIVQNINNDAFNTLDTQHHNVVTELDKFAAVFDSYRQTVVEQIEEQEKEYFQTSYQIYTESLNDSDEYVLSRINTLTVDNTNEYKQRIKLHTSWKIPAIYIRPKDSDIIDQMVSCDPLYVADHTTGLLEPVKKLWTKEYQARLRYQTISDNEGIFKKFPQNQFGLVVATEFFNFKPFEVIKRYLEELYVILRPGGVFVFTYNNCDLPGPVRNVEKSFNCYTPGHLLETLAESLGYEIIYRNNSSNGLNWLEIKKPGEIQSLRGGQALAQIKDSRLDI